jgi:hypothetical protein
MPIKSEKMNTRAFNNTIKMLINLSLVHEKTLLIKISVVSGRSFNLLMNHNIIPHGTFFLSFSKATF